MSEQMTVAVTQMPMYSLLGFFGFGKDKAIPIDILKNIFELTGIFSQRKIDDETANALLKSYEAKFGMPDDIYLRVNNFHKFIKGIHETTLTRDPFIDQVKNLGLLSKSELEEYAKDTGDWSHFLKRADKTVDKPLEVINE